MIMGAVYVHILFIHYIYYSCQIHAQAQLVRKQFQKSKALKTVEPEDRIICLTLVGHIERRQIGKLRMLVFFVC